MGITNLFGDKEPLLYEKVLEAKRILRLAVEEFQPTHIFGLFSGGHDSVCATDIAADHPKFTAAVHINTGTGIRQTREYVHETCKQRGWKLKEYKSHINYRDIVLEHGFPGPSAHRYFYIKLKERCLNTLIREHKVERFDRIILVTWVRKEESSRRMGTVVPVNKRGASVWVAPLLNWTTENKNEYIDREQIPRNAVVDRICMSGECLCGAFAKPGEMAELEAAYPDAAAALHALEVEAREAGVHAKWGSAPPEKLDPNQIDLPLCWSCEAKMESAG